MRIYQLREKVLDTLVFWTVMVGAAVTFAAMSAYWLLLEIRDILTWKGVVLLVAGIGACVGACVESHRCLTTGQGGGMLFVALILAGPLLLAYPLARMLHSGLDPDFDRKDMDP